MSTTLQDAKITVKIDVQQAEEAARGILDRRRRQGGASPLAPGGGGGQPPIAPPVPGDPGGGGGGGPGAGAQTIGALATGNVAGIPGLRTALGAVRTAFELEALQTVSSVFSGFFTDAGDAELRKRWAQAKTFRDRLSAIRDALEAGFDDMFEWFAEGISAVENKARLVLASVGAAMEGVESIEMQGAMGGEPGKAFEFAARIVRVRGKIAEALGEQVEAQQKIGREFLGQAIRDRTENARDKAVNRLVDMFMRGG
jgi:hypothetical protein